MSNILTTKDGHLFKVELNRPERQNQFTQSMLSLLGGYLREAEDDPEIRAILLTGAGDHFCAGGDVEDLLPHWRLGSDPFAPNGVNPTGASQRKLTKPLITVVQGACFNGGLEFALASDICIAAESARFAFKEIHFATYPFAGGVFRFIRAAGRSNALRYILTGDEFDVSDALHMNLVSSVHPVGEVGRIGYDLARRISEGPPLAMSVILSQIGRWSAGSDQPAFAGAIEEEVRLLNSADCAEAVAAMMEKRAPRFSGR